jgi:phosphosulfolactate phosphohydrolase-like enzyme
LEVEAIRDSMLAVSGQLNPKRFGPAMKPGIPAAALEANTDKEKVWQASDAREASRRSIYAFIKRGLVVPMLETLDLADTVSSCPQRQVTTVAPQALSLFNGDFVNQQSNALRRPSEAGSW